MKIIGAFATVFLFLTVNTNLAGDKKEVKMHGQIIDATRFTASIQWDAESTRQSALKGNPLGFYDTKDGLLYVVTMKSKDAKQVNDVLLPYIGERVYVKGTKYIKKMPTTWCCR